MEFRKKNEVPKPKNKKFFRNKAELIITTTIFILCIFGFIYLSEIDFQKDELKDNALMHSEHREVPLDNIFVYINASEANSKILHKNVLILFGTSNEWTGNYAKILNEVAKEVGIDKRYDYDIEDDRSRNNATYEHIVNRLKNYTITLDDGSSDLFGPTLLVIKNGVISLFDDETAVRHGNQTPKEYWNDYNTNLKKHTLKSVLEDYKG